MIGTPSVTVQPDLADPATAVDVTCYIDELQIQHGRDDSSAQPDASTATLSVSFESSEEEFPAGVEVGAILRVYVTFLGTTYTRFVGNVTDVSVGWDEAGTETPNAVVGQIIAAGPLADLGRRVIGDVPWGQELDGARVRRILTSAGVAVDAATSDPGTVQILPRDVDAQPALGLAQEVAESAGGILWETKGGSIRYADAEHRRNAAEKAAFDACDVLVTPTWKRDTQGLVNTISIGYGPTPSEGEQPRYGASNAASIARYGRYDVSTTTVLAALADAQAMGQLLLTRNATPVWLLTQLPIDMLDLVASETAGVLGLDMHDLIRVTGLPTTGDLPSTTSLWVEGWTETLRAGEHELTLSVSGYCRTSPPPRWDDVPSAWTWDTLAPSLTWDGATCIGPTPSEGRWNDTAASLRWDLVAPSVTWDTWPY